MNQSDDKKYIRRCIALSKKSYERGAGPFASLIVKDDKILAESINGASKDITAHAEIIVMRKARKLRNSDLADCTLYTNCEPCPMCSFMIREFKVGRVVFALHSPFMGGYSKWKILEDKDLSEIKPYFGGVPKIRSGVCEKEAVEFFDKIMFPIQKKYKNL